MWIGLIAGLTAAAVLLLARFARQVRARQRGQPVSEHAGT